MREDQKTHSVPADRGRVLPPAAQRALQEAEERRKREAEQQATAPREIGGRKGLDPARYGDWEVKGIASDF
ncbi:DUF1674 domain-containing protein [Chelativorans sp.]|uniref:DUF1674 domain-containing protein n=1 Tax=Chelativorans sp. TaxID=2203393 RepID=UPI0028118F93|nr:DUF1674 domain-containing protein [Chelativorans sp.]